MIYLLVTFCVVIAIKVWRKYSTENGNNVKIITSARSALLIMIMFVLIISVAGCTGNTAFSGSKTGNDNQFLVDFDVLNTTVNNKMLLSEGERIGTTVDIKKGRVDIVVENENGKIAYRGNDVESAHFGIVIEETGTYTFYVTGSKAKGSVYFNKL